MAIKVRNEGPKVSSNINVTPMVDVMLVLLIIFMVITPMLQPGISVRLAQANNPVPMPDAVREGALIVAVMNDGTIFFGTQKVSASELTAKVRDRITNRTDRHVYVKADARTRYKSVVDVVDDFRSAGADQLGLLTEHNKISAARIPGIFSVLP